MNYKSEIARYVSKFEEQGYKKLCFWAPVYNIGGGTNYYCELAQYLVMNTSLEVYYVDFKEGYATKILRNTNVKFIEYIENEKYFPIKDKCLIIVNSTRVIQLKRMNKDSKILFWHWETAPTAWHVVFLMHEYIDFFNLCKENNAMVFHDWSSRNSFKQQYNFVFENKSYLYMLVPSKDYLANPNKLINENEINLTWVGRISHEKINSIFYLIDNFSKYQSDKRKVLHIVGDGYSMGALRKYVDKYKDQIYFDIVGTIEREDLDDYLIKNTDILFAMGRSSIEGAALKIPTAVVLLDTKPIKSNLFYWLFNTKEYCVGVTPRQTREFDIHYSRFNDLLDDIYMYNQKGSIAEKCYNYYMSHLSNYDSLVCDFLKYMDQSTLTMEKLESCIKYIPYNNIRVRRKRFLKKILSLDVINKEEFLNNE